MDKINTKHIKNKLDKIFLSFLNNRVFSGSTLAYSFIGEKEVQQTFLCHGKTGSLKGSYAVNKETLFDLASLTKPLVTILSLLVLLSEGKIRLEDKLTSLLNISIPNDKKEITLKQLMAHTSGLPAHKPYFQSLLIYPIEKRKEKILQLIVNEKLAFQPGSRHLYSDLDYILLGCILESITGKGVDDFWREKVLLPFGLDRNFCFSNNTSVERKNFSSTGTCPWSGKELCGKVHDDNSRVLGGLTGHAGLFGNIVGVTELCENILMLYKGLTTHPFIDAVWLRTILKKQKGSTWTLGFDTPSQPYSSSGSFFSEKSVGHLGFTGTSFWIDLLHGVVVVLLTNRVISDKKIKEIQKFRPEIHNIIMEELVEMGYKKKK